jgi:hypothetical protein
MSYKNKTGSFATFVCLLTLTILVSSGCTSTPTDTAPVATINGNANKSTPAASMPPLEAREPDRYSITNTITITPTGTSPQTNIPPLQFSFAKLENYRRVSFKLPDPVGEVIYLEKPPMKYLIFPARNEYVELDPNELGFQLGEIMSPAAIVAQLKQHMRYEQTGTDTVNGRSAVKYRFTGATDTHTNAGTAEADSVVYVDQETGLPLRSEINTTSSSGAGARVVTVADGLQFSPDPSQFDVPTAMKKVTTAELKQQVQSFVATVRVIADYLRQQGLVTPTTPSNPQ